MLRVVFDTNILVFALWTPGGKPAHIIALLPSGKIMPCYSYQILREYRAVLNRPKLKFSGSQTQEILAAIERQGMLIAPEISKISLPDESDRKFYDTAKSCRAFLLTGNKKHYPAEKFIVSPAEFLAL